MPDDNPTAPTEETTWFDRAADRTSHVVAKPPFFIASLLIVIGWALSGPAVGFSHG